MRSYEEMLEVASRTHAAPRHARHLPRLVRLSLGLLWATGRRRTLLVLALTALTASGAGAVLFATRSGLAAVLQAAGSGGNLADALLGLVPLAIVASARAVLAAAQQLAAARAQVEVNLSTTARVLAVAADADLMEYEAPGFSNRIRQASNSSGAVTQAALSAVQLIGRLITIAAVAVAVLAIAPAIAALVLLACAPGWWASLRIAKADYEVMRKQVQGLRVVDYLAKSLTDRDQAKEVRAFGLGPPLLDRWALATRSLVEEQIERQRRNAGVRLAAQGVDAVLFAAVGAFVVWLVVSGRASLAAATTLMLAVQQLRAAVRGVSSTTSSIYGAALLLADLDELWSTHEEHVARRPQQPIGGAFSNLAVDSVTFRYPGSSTDALHEVDLDIASGEVIALVGENGSGKTTLAKLLAGLYTPTAGAIRWDGDDIADRDPGSVREHIAVIFQDFVRWELSALDNIALGRHSVEVDRGAVVATARAAGAHEFISDLPLGYDTELSKTLAASGADLSVGQWQRLAIARALYRQAPFIVLDEPTAALDPRAEHDLFAKIRELCAGRTVLLISHRFSTVRSADRIYVLDQGRIVEQGSHAELLRAGGQYAELFTLQAAAYLDPPRTAEEVPPAPV